MKMKKKKWFIILLTPVVLLGLLIALGVANNMRLFDEDYYVFIQSDGEKIKGLETPEGEEVWNREYNLKAYNEDGEEKEVSFDGYKNLKKGAYLKISVYGDHPRDVHRYEEVKENEVPFKVKEKLSKIRCVD